MGLRGEEAQAALAELRASGALPVELSDAQIAALSRYCEALLEYNAKTNLTAETQARALAERHVADGLHCVPLLKRLCTMASPEIADVGAGGGFIGIALSVAWPEARVTLIESLERKFRFLSAASSELRPGPRVLKKAAGPGFPFAYDAVVERALAPLPETIAICFPLLRPDGYLVAYQSAEPDPGEPALKKALAKSGGRLVESVPYRLPGETRDRRLAVFQKCSS